MIPYLIILFFTLPLTSFFNLNVEKNEKRINKLLFIWLIVIVVVSGLRGAFTADSYTYQRIFGLFADNGLPALKSVFNLDYHFNNTELGYIVINYVVGFFTNDFRWLQVVVALITYFPVIKWCENSPDIGLSLCIFLGIGTYIEGLNTVRNIMAMSLLMFGFKYIYSGEFKKYLFFVLLASSMHLSVLVMVPMYFVLRWKLTVAKCLLFFVAMVLFVVRMEQLAQIYNSFFLVANNAQGVLDLLHRRQANPTNVIVPVLIVIFTLVIHFMKSKAEDHTDMKQNVLVFGTIIWGLLKMTMLYSEYTTRFAAYFSPFIILLLPMELSKFNSKNRLILSSLVYLACGIFFLIVSRSYGKYYMFQQ